MALLLQAAPMYVTDEEGWDKEEEDADTAAAAIEAATDGNPTPANLETLNNTFEDALVTAGY